MKWSSSDNDRFDEGMVAATLRTWSFLAPPIRPGAAILAEYRRHFETQPGQPVLVFGATPEIIDLAIDLGCPRIVAMDWNADNFEAMRRIARHPWDEVEFVHGNWLEPVTALADCFGCAVCDGGPLFLRFPEEWRRISEAARLYLRPGGRWLSRGLDWPGEDRAYLERVQQLIDAFRGQAPAADNARREAFKRLTVQARICTFCDVVGESFAIDQREFARRQEEVAGILRAAFPGPDAAEIIDMNIVRLARPAPEQADMVTVAPAGAAASVLQALGFAVGAVNLNDVEENSGYVLAGTRP